MTGRTDRGDSDMKNINLKLAALLVALLVLPSCGGGGDYLDSYSEIDIDPPSDNSPSSGASDDNNRDYSLCDDRGAVIVRPSYCFEDEGGTGTDDGGQTSVGMCSSVEEALQGWRGPETHHARFNCAAACASELDRNANCRILQQYPPINGTSIDRFCSWCQ